MKTEKINEIVTKIEGEIRACFEGWDGAIKNKCNPVPIQDLDYWSNELLKVKKLIQGVQ